MKIVENEYMKKEDRRIVARVDRINDEEYEGWCYLCLGEPYFYTSSRTGEEVMKALEDHLEREHGLGRGECEWLGWH